MAATLANDDDDGGAGPDSDGGIFCCDGGNVESAVVADPYCTNKSAAFFQKTSRSRAVDRE
jgi:hypothetical protein